MLITYFDEVKYQKGRQEYYWVGGIVVDPLAVWRLETALNALSLEVFKEARPLKHTEFHAADILNGHAHFKGWPFVDRVELIKRLITILGTHGAPDPEIARIYVRIEPKLMTIATDYEMKAFMYFVERVQTYLKNQNKPGILIGDRESDIVSGLFSDALSGFRGSKTKYEYGKELENLIDTVHFTHSHHSRMIQLADLYVWLMQLMHQGDNGKWHRVQVIEHARAQPKLGVTHYKHWPTMASGYLPVDPAKVFGGQPRLVPPHPKPYE